MSEHVRKQGWIPNGHHPSRGGGKFRAIAALVAVLPWLALVLFGTVTSANAAPGVVRLGDHTDIVICSSAVAGSNPTTYTQVHVLVTASGFTPGGAYVYYLQADDNSTALAVPTMADINGNISIDGDFNSYNGTGLLPGHNYGDGIGRAPATDPPTYAIASNVILGGDCAPANNPPVAAFSINASSGPAPLVVNANGSASTDDNGTVSYNFAWGDGTSTGNQSSATATHTYTVPGSYTITLTVTDTSGLTGTTTKHVTVNSTTATSSPVPHPTTSTPTPTMTKPHPAPSRVTVTDNCPAFCAPPHHSQPSSNIANDPCPQFCSAPPSGPGQQSGLASTGAHASEPLVLGFGLLAIGSACMAAARRRAVARQVASHRVV